LGTLRLKLKEIFGMLDKNGKGFFDIDEMMVYFANNGILENNTDADLLFIRLDKNRNGKIDYHEVEDELQTLF
jgi:Ca2+-binding EF-hand superfamily protein